MFKTVYTDNPCEIPRLIENAAASGESGLDIVIKSGLYYLSEGIKISSPGIPVKLSSHDGARLIGGCRLSGASPVPENEASIRFPFAQAAVFECVLPRSPLPFSSRGFGRETTPSHSEAFFDGEPLLLAQFPRPGSFLNISGYGEGAQNEWHEENGDLKGGFYYESDRPKSWRETDGIMVHGYWCYDWANSYERVELLDTERGFIKTLPPYGNYQFRKNQRFSFFNVPQELSFPGDYFIDCKAGRLFFIPPCGEPGGEIIVSFLSEPMILLENASDITLSGLSFEACCGHAVKISGGENISIEGCLFKNIGNFGVYAEGTRRLRISGCDMHDTGDGGISVSSGDRASLTSGETVITNNHLYKIAKWSRTYVCPVNASGVGFEISHNLIHDCPHTAILFWGNDFTIENNEIYSVVMETGDAGAVYTGRDFTFRGNTVRKNYIHHLGGVGMGTMAVYNDDCVSGTLMEQNVFFEVSRAAFLGGGCDFIVRRNLFVNCYPSIAADGRGASPNEVWRKMVTELMRDRFYHIKNNAGAETSADGEPYISRYPELAKIDRLYRECDKPLFHPDGVLCDNLFCSEQKINYSWETKGERFKEENNADVSPDDFSDYEFGVFDLKNPPENGPARFCEVGLLREGRRAIPPAVLSSLKSTDGRLLLTLKNTEPRAVSCEMYFDTSGALPELEAKTPELCLAPFEVKTIDICAAPCEKTSVEARSRTPGVRPCRAHVRV